MEELDLSYTFGGDVKCHSLFENTPAVAQNVKTGNSLAVLWLRLHAPTAEGTSLIPSQGTKILCAEAKSKLKRLCS